MFQENNAYLYFSPSKISFTPRKHAKTSCKSTNCLLTNVFARYAGAELYINTVFFFVSISWRLLLSIRKCLDCLINILCFPILFKARERCWWLCFSAYSVDTFWCGEVIFGTEVIHVNHFESNCIILWILFGGEMFFPKIACNISIPYVYFFFAPYI